jgi:hypothetical protein
MDAEILDDTTPVEQWKPVVGWEGFYEVSDRGRVKSLARIITHVDGHRHRVQERILKPTLINKGSSRYFHVTLCRDGGVRWKHAPIHHLVFTAFHGPIPDGFIVDHRDRVTLNNPSSNLRLATKSQNAMNSSKDRMPASGKKGVIWHTKTRKWQARITVNGKRRSLGYYDDIDAAAEAYRVSAALLFGEFYTGMP